VRGHRVWCMLWLPLATRVCGQADGGRPRPGYGMAVAWPPSAATPAAGRWLQHSPLGHRYRPVARLPHPLPSLSQVMLLLVALSKRTYRATSCPLVVLVTAALTLSRTTYLPNPSPTWYVVITSTLCCCVCVAARGHTSWLRLVLTDAPPILRSSGHIPALPCLVGSWPNHLCRGRFLRCDGGSAPLSLSFS